MPSQLEKPKVRADEEVVPGLGGAAYADQLAGMVARSFCFTEAYSDQQGRADRTGAQPDILRFTSLLVGRAFKLGIPLFPHCIVRGSEEQNRLYKAGRSKARAGESPHNFGAAADIVHGKLGWELTRRQWAIIGHLGKEIAIQQGLRLSWGGDWKFYDPAHWELTEWRAIRAAYADGEDWDGRPSM